MENENNTIIAQSPEMLMDWNDTIENDGKGYVTLDEGDYNFTVTGFERGRHSGSDKIPRCNKAIITVAADNGKGSTVKVKFDLMLYRTMEWKISAFFRCIGQKKHGEKLVMDWNTVLGSHGRAHFKPRSYVNSNGNEKTANDVDYFLDYDPKFFTDFHPTATQQTGWQEVKDDEQLPFD